MSRETEQELIDRLRDRIAGWRTDRNAFVALYRVEESWLDRAVRRCCALVGRPLREERYQRLYSERLRDADLAFGMLEPYLAQLGVARPLPRVARGEDLPALLEVWTAAIDVAVFAPIRAANTDLRATE